MILRVNMYLMCKIKLKTWKWVKSDLIRAKSINSVQFYKLTKFMIWTKSGPNLTLKCLLTSFARLDKAEFLQGNIRHLKIYCGKVLGQMEFGNIIFQRAKVSRWILSNISN